MRIRQILGQRFIKLKDTLNVQIKQIYSVRKRVKDACKRQKIEHRKEGLYKTVYKCDIYARYLEYQPKPRPVHIKCKTIHMLSEEGKQSLPEFLVGASCASNRRKDVILHSSLNNKQRIYSNRPKINHSIDRGYIVTGSIGSPVCCSNSDRLEI